MSRRRSELLRRLKRLRIRSRMLLREKRARLRKRPRVQLEREADLLNKARSLLERLRLPLLVISYQSATTSTKILEVSSWLSGRS